MERYSLALAERERLNTDNVSRTAFYLAYWLEHPEVPWALLAHLVSRNAGYQMTDMRRQIERCRRGHLWVSRLGGPVSPIARARRTFAEIVRFLEAGNYLIFHDVYPQLAAYAAAKGAYLATGCRTAARVLEELPSAGVDPVIARAWRRFFDASVSAGFFRDKEPTALFTEPAVVQMALASVVNEQSYLEERLLARVGRGPEYVDPAAPFTLWFGLAAALGLTRLVFPMATEEAPWRAERLLVHTLGA
ncbi:MAG: DUF2515 family protein, partial [Polyangiaceae bacterium]